MQSEMRLNSLISCPVERLDIVLQIVFFVVFSSCESMQMRSSWVLTYILLTNGVLLFNTCSITFKCVIRSSSTPLIAMGIRRFSMIFGLAHSMIYSFWFSENDPIELPAAFLSCSVQIRLVRSVFFAYSQINSSLHMLESQRWNMRHFHMSFTISCFEFFFGLSDIRLWIL